MIRNVCLIHLTIWNRMVLGAVLRVRSYLDERAGGFLMMMYLATDACAGLGWGGCFVVVPELCTTSWWLCRYAANLT